MILFLGLCLIKRKLAYRYNKPEDKNLLQSKTLVRTFGREEDCVELHVYDLNNNLLTYFED